MQTNSNYSPTNKICTSDHNPVFAKFKMISKPSISHKYLKNKEILKY